MANHYLKNESGSTAVEFALIAVIFLTIVFGIMEAGRIFWTQNAIQYSVEVASRAALVDEDITEEEVETSAEEALEDMMISSNGFSVDVAIVTDDDIDYVEIDATYQYEALVEALLPASLANIELEASTRRPLVWIEE